MTLVINVRRTVRRTKIVVCVLLIYQKKVILDTIIEGIYSEIYDMNMIPITHNLYCCPLMWSGETTY